MTPHRLPGVPNRNAEALEARLLAALRKAGKNVEALSIDDTSSFDQFHSGGKDATLELGRVAGISATTTVLDVGGGLGGPARTLAQAHGCRVTVFDAEHAYCEVGRALGKRMGFSELVSFVHGTAPALPFDNGSFDVAFLQHSTMNIPRRDELASQLRRVLKTGGRVAIQEVIRGSVEPVLYPTPWAPLESESFLVDELGLHASWSQAGFVMASWVDATESVRSRLASASSQPNTTLPDLGLHLLFEEPAYRAWQETWARDVVERRVRIVRAVFTNGVLP